MDFIDNLKKLGKKENWKYLYLVIWLMIGVTVIQFFPIIGIVIFLPLLPFLMFLFILSLIAKKDITKIATWKIILLLILSLPLMLLVSIFLIILFLASIISYFFFISWFIIYGSYLVGKKIDTKLIKHSKIGPIIRFILFFGGLMLSLLLLFLFIIGPAIIDFSAITSVEIPPFLIIVYFIVGGILIVFAFICILYMFKKAFNAWFGIFSLLVTIYTLFLVVKIYLSLDTSGTDTTSSELTKVVLLIFDLLILLYSVSTLMGSQAELLSKRIKKIGMDSVILWLILSKVAYEFVYNFPFDTFEAPLISVLNEVNMNELINLIKNIAVLGFFILLLIVIGLYEIIKYNKRLKEPKEEELEVGVEGLISEDPLIGEHQPSIEETEEKTGIEEEELSNSSEEAEDTGFT